MKFALTYIFLNCYSFCLYANNLALPCYGCHVSSSSENSNSIPVIEGIDEEYFITAFNEYKTKLRDNYLMHIISKGYSNQEIEDLAKFFSKKAHNDQ